MVNIKGYRIDLDEVACYFDSAKEEPYRLVVVLKGNSRPMLIDFDSKTSLIRAMVTLDGIFEVDGL